MLSRYFPQDITMHSFVNGTSSATRHSNWALVQKACRKNDFQLPPDLVAGCVAERVGAANTLLEVLFEHLTQRQIRRPEEARCFCSQPMPPADASGVIARLHRLRRNWIYACMWQCASATFTTCNVQARQLKSRKCFLNNVVACHADTTGCAQGCARQSCR
jgi:CH-like domain in sperm protein